MKNESKPCFSKSDPGPLGEREETYYFTPLPLNLGNKQQQTTSNNNKHVTGPSPRTVGANGGSSVVHGVKKMNFFKVVPRPLGMLKQMFLGRFAPLVAQFGPWKIPKCLEKWPFWDQKWVKDGSKTRFSKSGPGPFGMLKQVFLARFELLVTRFGPWKSQNGLKMGRFKTKNGLKMGQKRVFPKVILDHLVCSDKCC